MKKDELKKQIIEVAVIGTSFHDFKIWLKENEKPNEKYYFIQTIKDAIGKRFDRIEKLRNYYLLNNVYEIIDYIEIRLKSISFK